MKLKIGETYYNRKTKDIVVIERFTQGFVVYNERPVIKVDSIKLIKDFLKEYTNVEEDRDNKLTDLGI